MSGRSEKLGERIRDLTVRFGAEGMRSLQRYNELLQRVASGDLDESAVGGAYMQFVRDETERYFRKVADVSSGYYSALLELGSMYNLPFFEQAFNRWPPANHATSRRGGDVIELRGSLGDEAVGTFRVDNAGANSEEVSVVVSEFTGGPRSVPFRRQLGIQDHARGSGCSAGRRGNHRKAEDTLTVLHGAHGGLSYQVRVSASLEEPSQPPRRAPARK